MGINNKMKCTERFFKECFEQREVFSMKLQRIFAMTAVAAFALSTLTGCPWEQEDDAPSAPSSSSSRPSHDSDSDNDSDNDSDPDTPSSTPEEPEEDQGFTYDAEENCYTITSSEGLMNWAKQENVMTADCTLETNITVSSWNSIGDSNNPYTGTFDGNGKTISGLGAPLFDTIGSGGTVKNLTIDGTISGDSASGVASSNSGTIVNCTIKAAVNATRSSAGGIAIQNESGGKIIGCVVTGNVSGNYSAGGIAVDNYGTITGCVVTGEVSDNNTTGGIAAYNHSSITACAVTGDVEAKENGQMKGNAGGIVAYGNADTATACYYSGEVTVEEGGSVNDAGTPVTGGWTEAEIKAMNAQLEGCEYVFELDTTTGQPKLVKRNSAEQAVNRLLAQFWG